MPASNIFQQFGQGQARAQDEQRAQQNQAFNVEQQGFQRSQQMRQLDDQRKKALFTDARELNTRLRLGDNQGAMRLVTNRLESIESLGGDPTDTLEILGLMQSGNIQEALKLLDITEKVGVANGFLQSNEPSEMDNLKLEEMRLKVGQLKDGTGGSKGFAPEISPVQTDPETGQKFIIRTDKNTQESTRIDVKGAMGESLPKEEQRLIRRELIKDAGTVSKESFNSLRNIKGSISTMNEAIAAIDKGASTGAVERFLPSFTEATLELENAANRMGLDVVSATTFGALSEGELRLAMDTALPTKMEPKALKLWLTKRRDAKKKMARELNKMAITLGKGKVTIAEYLEKNTTAKEPQQDSSADFSGFKVVR